MIAVIKKKSLVIFAFIFLSVIVLISFFSFKEKSEAFSPYKFTVVIDAGHGGIDAGVIGSVSGVKESDLNLQISRRLKAKFEEVNFNVVMTRKDQNGLYDNLNKGFKKRDMQKRRNIIINANPDLVISIHVNKYELSYRCGGQVFYKAGDENGEKFAKIVQGKLNDLKTSNKPVSALKGDFYILNSSSAPSILVECGFLSNEEDERRLQTAEYQNLLVKTIFEGAFEFFTALTEKV